MQFKAWIVKKLGVTDELEKLRKELKDQQQQAINSALHEMDGRVQLMERTTFVGLDVGFKNPSWVVVAACVKDGHGYVECFQLPSNEIIEIQKFMAQYKRVRTTVDAPPQVRGWL